MTKVEGDGPGADEVLGAGQVENEFKLTNADDWLNVVVKAFPFDVDALKTALGDVIPAMLRHNSATATITTDKVEALKKFADNFAKWKELFDLAWLEKSHILEIFGEGQRSNYGASEITGRIMRRVVDLDIRPGVPEGSSPRGSVYIFADNIPVSEFGEMLVFPLRERGFSIETVVPGLGLDSLHHGGLPTPRAFATFSKAFNRQAFRS